jgi:predicted dienelactone hydrolase
MKSKLLTAAASIAFVGLYCDLSAVRADDAAYKDQLGPYKVKSIERLVLTDAKRKKDLQLRIHYPDGSGPFPLIVWSHGAGGSKDNYLTLMQHWASYGYVTIQPTHSDSRSLAAKFSDSVSFRDWQSRPADISFILDSLSEIEVKEPALKDLIDGKRIGVGGHSFGANTAQLIGGARAFPGGGDKSFEEPRALAVMLLSGQGPGEMLTEKSWSNFKKPMFVMSGSADGPTRTGQPAEWRKKPYELSPPGDKYLVWVDGLDHGYGGISGWNFNPKNKPNPDHVRYTKIATMAYWDAYLKDSHEARTYLESDKLTSLSSGAVHLEHK